MCKEMSQWNTLCGYLKQAKMSFFKNEKQEGKTDSVWEIGISRRGRIKDKGVGEWIWWRYYYSHTKMGKLDLLKILQEWGKGDKGKWWTGWIQLWYIVRAFVSVIMYPQYNNNKIEIFLKEYMTWVWPYRSM
jgi:hypothetical protein